jgi:hypothetical protein
MPAAYGRYVPAIGLQLKFTDKQKDGKIGSWNPMTEIQYWSIMYVAYIRVIQ